MTEHPLDTPQFFLTAPSRCPYLPDRQERKVFTHLIGSRAVSVNDALSHGGFRRSQNIAYRPACETCRACISVRVAVDDFRPGRTQRRVQTANLDLSGREIDPVTSSEQYELFRRYLVSRHSDGGMVDMVREDYSAMVEETQVDTRLVEYRVRDLEHPESGRLYGVALTDVLADGLSMVYSFYDTDSENARRSLGTFMILDHINRARRRGLPYLYLGYWVKGSRKMDYKRRFTPLEFLLPQGWTSLDDLPLDV
jgi:arginine-tRNA-protein transferase